jgi:hypothetical protein
MDYLKVTKRGSIMSCATRELVKSGTRLSKEECVGLFNGAAEVDRLVDQGYLVRLGEQTNPEEYPLPPQTTVIPPHPANVEKDEPAMETVDKGVATGNAPAVGEEAPITFDNGPWNLDPASLADKDIHELNVMVAERGGNEVSAFETVEEAVAWLSQDFQKEEAAIATS